MTLHGFLDVLQGFFIRVAPGVASLERWTVRVEDVLVRLDHDAKEIRLRRRPLRRTAFRAHAGMIPRIGADDQASEEEDETWKNGLRNLRQREVIHCEEDGTFI